MGIENTLERIAASLEKIAEVGEHTLAQRMRITKCAEWHATKAGMPSLPEAGMPVCATLTLASSEKVNEVMAAAEVTAEPEAPAAPEFTYDELKAKLIERGVNIAKGTKMTTLVKLWATYKDAPIAPNEPVEVELVEAEVIEPEAPAADEADLDLFDEEVNPQELYNPP